MSKHTDGDPLAELAAPRQRLDKLEAEHRELKRQATRTCRPAFFRKFLFSALPVALLLSGVGALYAVDALFIDKTGNIGAGTTDPQYALQISNFAPGDRYIALTTEGGSEYKTGIKLWAWQKDYGFTIEHDETKSGLNILRNYADGKPDPVGKTAFFIDTATGNVGIGTDQPQAKLDIQQEPRTDLNNHKSNTHGVLYITGAMEENSGIEFRHSDGTEGIGFGYETIYATGTDADQDLNIQPRGTGKVRIAGLETTGDSVLTGNTKVGGNLSIEGNVDIGKMATFDTANNRIVFPSGAPTILEGDLFVKGKLEYYEQDKGGWHVIRHGSYEPTDGKDWFAKSNPGTGPPPVPSDVRLKTELRPIPSALEKVNQLRGVSFHWNEQGLQYLTRDIATTLSAGPGASGGENRKLWQAERAKRYKDLSKTSLGVVAQDVEAVLPEAVTTDESGYKSVKYYELIPLVIEALKEEDRISEGQSETIARQHAEIQQLTVANQAALQQLKELQEVKQKLGLLEATVNKFLASGLSGNHDELISAGRVSAYLSEQTGR